MSHQLLPACQQPVIWDRRLECLHINSQFDAEKGVLHAVLRSAEDGNERDGLKGSSTACVVLIDTVQVKSCISPILLDSIQCSRDTHRSQMSPSQLCVPCCNLNLDLVYSTAP